VIAGVDGCRGGWLGVVEVGDGAFAVGVYDGLDHLLRHHPTLEVIAIDIPIGLTTFEPRACDLETRRALRPRGSVVFPAPLRQVVAEASYHRAMALNLSINQKGISKQAHAIYGRVHQIDQELAASERLRQITYEIHPERSFAAMNGDAPVLLSKHKAEGRPMRIALLDENLAVDLFDRLRPAVPRSMAKDDDVLDALAALWTARRIRDGVAQTHPANPPIDATGLPMRICY
jgi:predicted RNase H-like nuclease